MKKLVLLFSLLCFLFISRVEAQSNFHERGYYKGSMEWIIQINKKSDKLQKQNIKTVTGTRREYRKDSSLKRIWTGVIYKFNQEGKLTNYQHFNKKGKISMSYAVSYSKDGRISSIDQYHYSRYSHYEYNYYNDSLLAAVIVQTKKDASGIFYSYSQENRLIEERYVENGKQISRVEYAYYDDGSKRYTRIYNRKNKLTQTYNYDCGIDKTLGNKHKDTSTICSKTSKLPNGDEQTIKEELDEKGRIARTVTTFNKERKWYLTERYSFKNRLVSRIETKAIDGHHLREIKVFSKRGRLRFSQKIDEWEDGYRFYNSSVTNDDNERFEMIYSYTFY